MPRDSELLPLPDDWLNPHDPVDRHDAARILDVNLNRAREALRVLDDYYRFVRNDADLTEQIKRARHELTDLAGLLSADLLISARETTGDVGTAITLSGEMQRDTPVDVARINLKRLQESFRSLEEYGKIINIEFAAGVEQLRYRAYTIEKMLPISDDLRIRLDRARLYVLLGGSTCLASLDWTIAEAAVGGAGIFQLREKNRDDRALLQRAREMRGWTRRSGVLFIVNDRPDIARLAEADGVHLGQDDMPVRDARRIVGPEALIGISTHNMDQVRQAVRDGADYIGIGPTFTSTTKDFEELAGLEFIRAAVAATALPAFAIGGINPKTIAAVVQAGAKRVAVSAAIAQAEEPRAAAEAILRALVG